MSYKLSIVIHSVVHIVFVITFVALLFISFLKNTRRTRILLRISLSILTGYSLIRTMQNPMHMNEWVSLGWFMQTLTFAVLLVLTFVHRIKQKHLVIAAVCATIIFGVINVVTDTETDSDDTTSKYNQMDDPSVQETNSPSYDIYKNTKPPKEEERHPIMNVFKPDMNAQR